MNDYRMWWNVDGLYTYPMNDIYFDFEWYLEPKINHVSMVECMIEQLWAEREGLC